MCGIAGRVSIDGGDGDEPGLRVAAMLDAVAHRGPDDRGIWSRDGTALGHVRLSILDTSQRGHQPFVTDDGRGVIVFNGEVYNHRELRVRLEAEGVTFRSDTDTETVLYALHRWGVETAVPRFDGMFALAYCDRRDGFLWLARDRMGIKPLFMALTASGLTFASEMKALLAASQRTEVDVHAVLSLMLYERFDAAETPYQGIELFQPGRIMRYRAGRVRWHTYFDLVRDMDVGRVGSAAQNFPAVAARFEGLLTRSVEMHLLSDVPLATMCSGGIDSGLVTAIAARSLGRVTSYVADIEGMGGEERRRAQLVADAAGAELRSVTVDRARFLAALPQAIQANDQPLFFAQDIALMVVAEQIRRDGYKVVLTGDGADELFGGYPWYVDAHRHWARLARLDRLTPDNRLTRWLGSRVRALQPNRLRRELDRYQLASHPVEYVATTFNMVAVGGMNRTLRQRELFQKLAGLPLPQRAFLSRNFEDVYVHLRECLNALDRMTMRHSIEARVPFIESELIRLGMDLPVDHRFARGVRKRLVHDLAGKLLPSSVIDLPKIGFTMPPTMWRGLERMLIGGRVADLLKWPADRQREAIELVARKPRYLFRLLGCEIWLRVCVEGQCPEACSDDLRRAAAAR